MSYFFFNGYYSYEMGLTVCFPHQVLALRQTKAPIDLQYDFTLPPEKCKRVFQIVKPHFSNDFSKTY